MNFAYKLLVCDASPYRALRPTAQPLWNTRGYPVIVNRTWLKIIDPPTIPMRTPSGHVYHLNQDIVVEDHRQIIKENRPAEQRRNLRKEGDNQWRLEQAKTE